MLARVIFISFLLLFTASACVEPYEFVIEREEPVLVVEGLITDASYQETLQYPSDGRYFTVRLSYTQNVTNEKSKGLSGATVNLVSSEGGRWKYTEQEAGTYQLFDKAFKAVSEESHKLKIVLADENSFESEWLVLPALKEQPMGEISFDEVARNTYKVVAGKKLVRSVEGIAVKVHLPAKPSNEPEFYRWDYHATWMYVVPESPSINRTCWVTNKLYLKEFTLHKDNVGGYKKELFFVETHRNERFYTDFSLLIRQLHIHEDYYQFLNELQLQSETNLNDAPPYNLKTNIQSVNSSHKVVGFFGIGREKAIRWYFNRWELSYHVEDHVKEIDCIPPPQGLGGEHCTDCLAYWNGSPSTEKPSWWIDREDRK